MRAFWSPKPGRPLTRFSNSAPDPPRSRPRDVTAVDLPRRRPASCWIRPPSIGHSDGRPEVSRTWSAKDSGSAAARGSPGRKSARNAQHLGRAGEALHRELLVQEHADGECERITAEHRVRESGPGQSGCASWRRESGGGADANQPREACKGVVVPWGRVVGSQAACTRTCSTSNTCSRCCSRRRSNSRLRNSHGGLPSHATLVLRTWCLPLMDRGRIRSSPPATPAEVRQCRWECRAAPEQPRSPRCGGRGRSRGRDAPLESHPPQMPRMAPVRPRASARSTTGGCRRGALANSHVIGRLGGTDLDVVLATRDDLGALHGVQEREGSKVSIPRSPPCRGVGARLVVVWVGRCVVIVI